jgi:hypothetical protein
MGSVLRAAGLVPVALDQLHSVREVPAPLQVAGLIGMPVGLEEGEAFTEWLFQAAHPACVVVIEKGGLNSAGRIHTSRGHDTTQGSAKADLLVAHARRVGVPTIAIGDGGNEVGMGLIRDFIRTSIPYGDRCRCPCEAGIAPVEAVDALVVAAVSNWGAYGVAAALSLLTGQRWPHDPLQERRILEAAGGAGFCDGPTGVVGPVVDGLPLEVHQAIVTLLREIVEKAFWHWR